MTKFDKTALDSHINAVLRALLPEGSFSNAQVRTAYLMAGNKRFKQLLRDFTESIVPEKGRDYSQDMTDEQSKVTLMALQYQESDLIDTITHKADELLGDKK